MTNEEILANFEPNCEYPSYYHESNIYTALDLARADERDNKWISVEERLPTEEDADENGKVLLYRDMNTEQKAQAKSIHDWFMVKHCDKSSKWQPLPAAPTPPKQ